MVADRKEYKRMWAAANKEKIKGYSRKYRLANREKLKRQIREWRSDNPEKVKRRADKYNQQRSNVINSLMYECSECASTESMVFHHIDPFTKKFNMSHYPLNKPQEFIEELVKCVVLCRSCHINLHRIKGGEKQP